MKTDEEMLEFDMYFMYLYSRYDHEINFFLNTFLFNINKRLKKEEKNETCCHLSALTAMTTAVHLTDHHEISQKTSLITEIS